MSCFTKLFLSCLQLVLDQLYVAAKNYFQKKFVQFRQYNSATFGSMIEHSKQQSKRYQTLKIKLVVFHWISHCKNSNITTYNMPYIKRQYEMKFIIFSFELHTFLSLKVQRSTKFILKFYRSPNCQ